MNQTLCKTVYLVCGISGSGKSWVCNQLKHMIHYVSWDKDNWVEPTREIELHDRVIKISTTIKRWRATGIQVIPVFVMGDFLTVKQQLLSRGGKLTPSIYSRWKRMKSLSAKYSVFTGSSIEVLKWLKTQIKNNDHSYIPIVEEKQTTSKNIEKYKVRKDKRSKDNKPFIVEKKDFIKRYTSRLDACNELGIAPCSISLVLNGKIKTTHGYTVRYEDHIPIPSYSGGLTYEQRDEQETTDHGR